MGSDVADEKPLSVKKMTEAAEGPMTITEKAYKYAYDRAVRLLARRAYSVWELQRKLRQGKTSWEVARRVCERCQELGYLDDAVFALSRARYRLFHGRYGPGRVWAELRALRVDEQHIQQALDELLAETSVVHLASVALFKRFGHIKEPAHGDDSEETYEAVEHVGLVPLEFLQDGISCRLPVSRKEGTKKQYYDFLARRGFNDEVIWQVLE